MLLLAYFLSTYSFGMYKQNNASLEKREYSYKKLNDDNIKLPEINGQKIQRSRKPSFEYSKNFGFREEKKISFDELDRWVNKTIKKQGEAVREICNVVCAPSLFGWNLF